MAYPTQSAALALEQIDNHMVQLKRRAAEAQQTLATSTVTSEYILNVHRELQATNRTLAALKDTPGILAHARAVKNDAQLDAAAEFSAIQSKLAQITSWIRANLPANNDGWLNHLRFNQDQDEEFNTFAPAVTAALRSYLAELEPLIQE